MPFVHDSRFEEPCSDASLWRYMEYWQFVSLLDTSALYFPPCHMLGDSFEGSFLPHEFLRQIDASGRDGFTRKLRSLLPYVKVSCWHLNEDESAVFWDKYTRRNGIAIRTTFRDLTVALKVCPQEVRGGKIAYLDAGRDRFTDEWPVDHFKAVMWKRRIFQGEREVRAFVFMSETSGGLQVQVDLNALIKGVCVGPGIPASCKPSIESVARKYGLDAPVCSSSLTDRPAY